jgi:ABC-type Fe3+-siderophore transport system permease subunit
MSEGMGMDIRLPIGLMFCIIGAMIAGYGVMTQGDPMYADHSLGINVNICWGSALVLFGLVMFALVWRAKKSAARS